MAPPCFEVSASGHGASKGAFPSREPPATRAFWEKGCPSHGATPQRCWATVFRPDPPRFGLFYPKRRGTEKGTGVPVTFSTTSGRSGVQRTL